MKIKWKIVLALDLLLVSVIIISAFAFQLKITKLVDGKTTAELSNYSTLGLSLIDATYPGDWRLDGDQLYKGETLLNENYKLIDDFSSKTGILATIFAGDTRISTTVKDDAGVRKIGTQASAPVIEAVLTGGKDYQGAANVAGKDAATYYIPLKDKDGNIIGMWFVGIYTKAVNAEIAAAMRSIILSLGICLLFGTLVSFILGDYMAKGYIALRGNLEKLENGDFNAQFKSSSLSRKDEIGDISRSYHHMQEKVKSIISLIKEEASQIADSSELLAENANQVHRDVEDISATTEQLSAGMEETAASSQEMSATTISIVEEINRVTDKTISGQTIAAEIKGRAAELKTTASQSQKSAIELYQNVNHKLRGSLEKASSINEIKTLSKTILGITSQTKLLALNASIESARAGEAGKGFSVVAQEISVLAQNSKNAVSQIDAISNDISMAVEAIVQDSMLLLDFMDHKVIKDYDVLVKTSEQYHEDADTIEDMVTGIRNSAAQLNESINYIHKAVEEVATATNEGSMGSADIAEKSTSIFHKTNEVLDQANTNQKTAQNLHELVQFFKI